MKEVKKKINPILIITKDRNQALMTIKTLRSIFRLMDMPLCVHCVIVSSKLSFEDNIKKINIVVNSFNGEYLHAFINSGFVVTENVSIISRLKSTDGGEKSFKDLSIPDKTKKNIELNSKIPAFNDFFRVLLTDSNYSRFLNTTFVFNSKSKEINDDAEYSLKEKFKVKNTIFNFLGNIFQLDLEKKIVNKGIFAELDVYKKINQ